MDTPLYCDRDNKWILGVCSGLARAIDWNPRVVRAVATLALVLLGPFTLIAYLAAAWIAD